jgi:signal transduction histidine kinase
MYFDDRLATVLRTGIGSDRGLRTQYRQLLDLLGTLPPEAEGPLVDAAYDRFASLSRELPPAQRSAIIREPGMRLASPRLVTVLAGQDIEVAAAAMAVARLSDGEWQALIPELPVAARGFLRHRRDLEDGANTMLQRLGIGDLVLPGPDVLELSDLAFIENETNVVAIGGYPPPSDTDEFGDALAIGALVRRIEAFQRARSTANGTQAELRGAEAPRLPLEDPQEGRARNGATAFDFSTDAAGRINWCDPAIAPMAVGLSLASRAADAPARLGRTALDAIRHRQPLRSVTATIAGAPAIAGQWRIDASPQFAADSGRFLGYYGRMRRLPPTPAPVPSQADPAADRMRQILHELRTPVNAIQGFAEIIQQQLYGPAPHEYRALAATIASDAARILAGFDELDRLARLESGALELEEGCCDLVGILANLAAQVRPALLPRGSEIALWGADGPALVPLAQGDAERLCWRLLATVAGEATAGEEIDVHIAREGARAIFAIELPASLAGTSDIFSASLQSGQRTISAGMFGTGFTLRLARAEAQAAGGSLSRDGDTLRLSLPLLTGQDELPSHDTGNAAEGTGANQA